MNDLLRYIEIVNEMERAADKGENFKLSEDERFFIRKMQSVISQDEKLRKIVEDLFTMAPEERLEYLKNLEEKKDEKIEVTDDVEDAISKVFGIDTSDINHHFLDNGREIFSFYSSLLGRNVVLESGKKGLSLLDQLKSLQDEANQYENDKEVEADDILLDEAKRSDIELEMLTKDEIYSSASIFQSLDEEDLKKLNYLLVHYEELQIQGINVENMIFIDKDGKIKEITLSKDGVVTIGEPKSESSSDRYEEDSLQEDNESALSDMFNDNDSMEYEDELIEKREKFREEKAKVFVKTNPYNDSQGFTNNVLYIFLAVFALVVTTFLIISWI